MRRRGDTVSPLYFLQNGDYFNAIVLLQNRPRFYGCFIFVSFSFWLVFFFFCRAEVNARVVPEIKSDLARTSSVGFNFLASAGITSLSN